MKAKTTKKKETVEITPEEVVVEAVPEVEESAEKSDFRKLIEAYREQNPVKFEQKKEELFAQLNNLK